MKRTIQIASELNKLSGRFAEMARKKIIINGKKTILIKPEELKDITKALSNWADVLLEELENRHE